jgi:hypothetical protein
MEYTLTITFTADHDDQADDARKIAGGVLPFIVDNAAVSLRNTTTGEDLAVALRPGLI